MSSTRLSRIASSWERRARVRCHRLPDNTSFQAAKLDFLPEWLPFGTHVDFITLPDEAKQKILSIGWLLYNQSTIDIEYQLVIPFCLHLVRNKETFSKDYHWRQLLFQTITDESYHVQLTEHASEITKHHRQLSDITLPVSHILQNLEHGLLRHQEQWERELIKLAACVVTETVIGEHLGVVAKCQDDRLQTLVVETTKAHMLDENVHATIFDKILREYYVTLSNKEKQFFQTILPEVISWFMFGKLHAWKTVLPNMQIPKTSNIIDDTATSQTNDIIYDISSLSVFMEEFGLHNLQDQVMHHTTPE